MRTERYVRVRQRQSNLFLSKGPHRQSIQKLQYVFNERNFFLFQIIFEKSLFIRFYAFLLNKQLIAKLIINSS